MWSLEDDLRQEFQELAGALQRRLLKRPSPERIRSLIVKRRVGTFSRSDKLSSHQLKSLSQQGSLAGVDGSTNRGGGKFPYSITLQRALAKGCGPKSNELVKVQALCPLLVEPVPGEEDYQRLVKESLASLEAQVAKEYIERYHPPVLLIDGSLVRLKIEAQDRWEELKDLALAQGTVLVGVVEGISTDVIGRALRKDLGLDYKIEDWELLSDLLEIGEVLEVDPGLFKPGFKTCFARLSLDPKPIGVDLLLEQEGELQEFINLLYSLTPRQGRGIPLWLDIIDEKVRITDAMMEGLFKHYLGQAHYQFILEKRRDRHR